MYNAYIVARLQGKTSLQGQEANAAALKPWGWAADVTEATDGAHTIHNATL